MTLALLARVQRLEASIEAARPRHHVISDLGRHGLKTEAELDAEERDLFARGVALPGDEVVRVVHIIVDPPARQVRLLS